MKNVIKKISAIAMAFTLLGVGTVVTKSVAPKSDNTLTACAYSYPCTRYDGHAHGNFIHTNPWGQKICNACGCPVYY